MQRLTAFLLVLFCMMGSTLRAQGQAAPQVDSMWQSYRDLNYTAATDSARLALAQVNAYAPDELAQIHTLLGLIAYANNQLTDARGQFLSALSLNPELELDPLLVSPKILEFFDAIKAERARLPADAQSGEIRYVVVEDLRIEATLRSMLVPGWGQLHKGDRRKGWVLLGTWGTALGGTTLTFVQRQQAKTAYEDANTVEEAQERYDTYNRWYRTHRAVLLGMASVWVYSYVDALISERPASPAASFSLTPVAGRDALMQAQLQVRF